MAWGRTNKNPRLSLRLRHTSRGDLMLECNAINLQTVTAQSLDHDRGCSRLSMPWLHSCIGRSVHSDCHRFHKPRSLRTVRRSAHNADASIQRSSLVFSHPFFSPCVSRLFAAGCPLLAVRIFFNIPSSSGSITSIERKSLESFPSLIW